MDGISFHFALRCMLMIRCAHMSQFVLILSQCANMCLVFNFHYFYIHVLTYTLNEKELGWIDMAMCFFVFVMGQMVEMSSVVETPRINTNANGNGKYAFECSAQFGQ